MFMVERFYRLRRATDTGFVYDEGDISNREFDNRAGGKRALAKAYVAGQIKAKLVDFVEIRESKRFSPIDVVVLSTPEFLQKISDEFVCRCVKTPYYTDDPDVVAWMVGGDSVYEDPPFSPIFIIRANLEDAQDRINKFFEGFISDIHEESNGEKN